jgi:hypothetical protein
MSFKDMMNRWSRLAAKLALALLPLVLTPVHGQELPSFELTIRAGRFYPETIEVPANTKFKLRIKNEGPGAEEFESIELRKEKVLAPGASSFLIFQPLKPGSYKFFGEFHPDTAQGRIVAK